ncbi:hypothetical protein LENED_008096 [Lentinula edodes]|uniref:Uncharacterized protein n=1 Tax=Lentinula edodes TaxID=5353 RepID=A0A1Q3EG65_LENED|nr:hypothetical protein LENED_008096 [Lentinula edodes]
MITALFDAVMCSVRVMTELYSFLRYFLTAIGRVTSQISLYIGYRHRVGQREYYALIERLMSGESSQNHVYRETGAPRQIPNTIQDASTNNHMLNALPFMRHLVLEWLQNLLSTMSCYQQLPELAPPYDGYPLPKGFPFPITIRPALRRSLLPLVDLLYHLPLLSHREDVNAWAAGQAQASDVDAILLQSELFHWVEEVDGNDQLYWGMKAYLIMYGYPLLRWVRDVNGEWISPLMWELRWGTTLLGALELNSSMFQESNFQPMMGSLNGEFILQSLILSVQTRTAIVLSKSASAGFEFIRGRKLGPSED